jgi:hypothetical protein
MSSTPSVQAAVESAGGASHSGPRKTHQPKRGSFRPGNPHGGRVAHFGAAIVGRTSPTRPGWRGLPSAIGSNGGALDTIPAKLPSPTALNGDAFAPAAGAVPSPTELNGAELPWFGTDAPSANGRNGGALDAIAGELPLPTALIGHAFDCVAPVCRQRRR